MDPAKGSRKQRGREREREANRTLLGARIRRDGDMKERQRERSLGLKIWSGKIKNEEEDSITERGWDAVRWESSHTQGAGIHQDDE
jgi:hypothetical protein